MAGLRIDRVIGTAPESSFASLTFCRPPGRLVKWLFGCHIPGGLGIIVGDRVTLGYASCFGPPAAYLALARRGLFPVVRLRRTFPAYSAMELDRRRVGRIPMIRSRDYRVFFVSSPTFVLSRNRPADFIR